MRLLHKFRHSKLFYKKKSKLDLTYFSKSLQKDVIVHIKPIEDYQGIPTHHKSNFITFLNHQTKVQLPNEEFSILPLIHYKSLKKFETHDLPLTINNTQALIRIMKVCHRSMKDVSLKFTNFQSLTSSACIELHLKICKNLKRLKRVSRLELILAVCTYEILKCIGENLSIFKELKCLILDFPQKPLSLSSWEFLSKAIEKQPCLQALSLRVNLPSKNEESKGTYFDFLTQLKNLKSLSLLIYQALPTNFLVFSNTNILKLDSLTYFELKLWSNESNYEKTLELFMNLDFPNLINFKFLANRIEDHNGSALIWLKKFLKSRKCLTSVMFALQYCSLEENSYRTISEMFPPSLQSLYFTLKQQLIVEEGYHIFSNNFSKLSKLTEIQFDFSVTRMNNACLFKLISVLGTLDKIEKFSLNISGNEVKDEGIVQLAKVILLFKNIKTLQLNISGNHFTTIGLHSLVESLKSLSLLTYLSLNIKDCRNVTISMRNKIFEQLAYKFEDLKRKKNLVLIK